MISRRFVRARSLAPRALAGVFGAFLLAGCEGSVQEPAALDDNPDQPHAGRPSASSGGGGNAAGGRPGVDAPPQVHPETGAPYVTRIGRLTHTQYDTTVRDLLFLDAEPSSAFQPDPVFGGYDNSAESLAVADRLGRDYRRAAEELAERAVNDPSAYAKLVTCTPSTQCSASFVREFGRRAYRRPLASAEQALFIDLHAQGAELVGSGDAFKDGVRVVIEAMLQSPKFLYRAELTREPASQGLLALGDFEVAQRLSYTLWNTMPDDALLAAAERGSLGQEGAIADEAARLLDDVRAEGPVANFHHQWLQLARYEDLLRSPELYPNFAADLPMQEETLAFVRHVVFDLQRGYRTLMTAPFSFVDARLAKLYGLTGNFGTQLTKADLDPEVRGGILTQIGFLASHAYPNETSPIHRGVFVHRRLLCNDIPDPPPGTDTSEGAVENPRTTREGVAQQTSASACRGCHDLINPPGFAFESFDAAGQVRSTDRGQPVDTTGEIQLDGSSVSFSNAKELTEAIAASRTGRLCYARNLLRYAYGRREVASDQALLDEIADRMADDAYGVKAALLTLTSTPSFRLRAPNQD